MFDLLSVLYLNSLFHFIASYFAAYIFLIYIIILYTIFFIFSFVSNERKLACLLSEWLCVPIVFCCSRMRLGNMIRVPRS